MGSEQVQPLYLDSGRHRLFAVLHDPGRPSPGKAAILICSPWGWEEVASYRPRRAWAQLLADAGHPVLRFDLPGTGNSSGGPRDPDLVAEWVLAVRAAAAWLGDASGSRVAGLGLGLGGLLALEAMRAGTPLDELILWGTPAAGRSFVREARTFSRLQAWHASAESSGGLPAAAHEIEASGFVLSEETIAALEALDPGGAPAGTARRALLIGRHTGQSGGPLAEAIQSGGAEVELATGKGWAAMVSHPERSRLPADVAERVREWLSAGEAPAEGDLTERPGNLAEGLDSSARELRLEIDGRQVLEAPIAVELPFGAAFGILASPAAPQPSGLCAVFLNAGGVRDTGPNRMWVERSRAWAAKGVPSLRLDLEGIGEAGGDPAGVPPGEEFFSAKYEPQVEAVLSALGERGCGSRFLLVGLCSGGYFSYRAALGEDRVRSAFLINPGALVWRPGLLSEREARKASRLFQRRWVARLVRGEIGLDKIGATVRSLSREALDSARRLGRSKPRRARWRAELGGEMDRLADSGARLVLAFSGGEPMEEELDCAGFEGELERWPNVEMKKLPGADHTVRPLEGQAALARMLDAHLDAEVERAAAGAGELDRSPRPLPANSD
jgi:alpha-beta hydrolase superfamily lysophospholipase